MRVLSAGPGREPRSKARPAIDARVEPVRSEIPLVEPEREAPQHLEPASPDRLPDPADGRVRDELEAKLRSLTAR